MSRGPGAPPDEPGQVPSVIDLSDRRPTPKEVPAFALERLAAERAVEEDPRTRAYSEAMDVFEEPPYEFEGRILQRLVELAAPEVRRFAFPSIRQTLRQAQSLPEARLVEWEKRLGAFPARLLMEPWVNEPAFKLAGTHLRCGAFGAQKGDSGVILGSELYLLASGRLANVEPLGYWKLYGERATRSLKAIGHARLVECWQAAYFHQLVFMVTRLKELLWYVPADTPLAPPGADLEARRDRFVAVVKELTRATGAYKEHLRRVTFGLG